MALKTCLNLKEYLGEVVHVSVDRPLGSVHPEDSSIVYPINYGYVPGVISGDGEELDAYILGVDDPVNEFTGVTIAAVLRNGDIEGKLVVAPSGVNFSSDEIWEKISFREMYYDSLLLLAKPQWLKANRAKTSDEPALDVGQIETSPTTQEVDGLKALLGGVGKIQDEAIRAFVVEALIEAPCYFYKVPSSASGKHHPKYALGEGGLVRHTTAAMYIGYELADTFALTEEERDMALAALALHDTLKYGIDYDIRYHNMHPFLPRDYYRHRDTDLQSMIDERTWDIIFGAIESHMGSLYGADWTSVKKARVESKIDMVVHLADYVVSRRNVSFEFHNKEHTNG